MEKWMTKGALVTAFLGLALALTPAAFAATTPAVKVTTLQKAKDKNAVKAEAGKTVSVHYTGWLFENNKRGKKFDSSLDRKQPFEFLLGASPQQVISGWEKGLLEKGGMKVGEKRRFIIPPDMGYGASGTPDGAIPPNSTLEFEVELLAVK